MACLVHRRCPRDTASWCGNQSLSSLACSRRVVWHMNACSTVTCMLAAVHPPMGCTPRWFAVRGCLPTPLCSKRTPVPCMRARLALAHVQIHMPTPCMRRHVPPCKPQLNAGSVRPAVLSDRAAVCCLYDRLDRWRAHFRVANQALSCDAHGGLWPGDLAAGHHRMRRLVRLLVSAELHRHLPQRVPPAHGWVGSVAVRIIPGSLGPVSWLTMWFLPPICSPFLPPPPKGGC